MEALGCEYCLEFWNLSPKTRKKVCVWCVLETYTRSVSAQKLTFLIEKYTSFQIAIFLSKYD